jgi:hypothetical protein
MSQQLQITGGAKVRSLEGVITGSTGVLGSLPINASNGIPQLDVNGKILVSQLPNSVMEYKGTWNAATNTPTLADGTGNQGDVYLCNVAGTVNFGSGPISFVVGDQVIYSGTIWQKASGATGTVTSVAVTESGDALTITGSPITTSGTINIGFAGSSAQYVAGDGSLITFPSLTGYVPYTGATANVDLGTFDLTTDIVNLNQLKAVGSGGLNIYSNSGTHIALMGGGGGAGTTFYGGIIGTTASFTSSGSSNTFDINHSSGSGITLNITKGGNGEGLYINKTSGSGNAATIIGTLNATTLVKSGGTSSQFLKADGSVDSSTYITLASLSATTPLSYNNTTGAFSISKADDIRDGYLSSADWTTFNNKQNALTNPITGTGASGRIAYFNGTTTQTSSANLTWDNTDAILSTNSIYNFNNTTNAYMLSSDGENIGSIFNVSAAKWSLGYGTSATALGTPALTWDNSGKVGIGTTSPSNLLDVNGTGRFTTNLFINRASAGNSNGLSLQTAGTNNWYIGSSAVGANTDLQFYNHSAAEVVFSIANTTGNVGIGTTSPFSQGTSPKSLEIAGTNFGQLFVSANSGATRGTLMARNGTSDVYIGAITNSPLAFGTNDTERMRITNGGLVGIGTSSPTNKLTLYNTVSYNQVNDQLRLIGNNSGGGSSSTPSYNGGIAFTQDATDFAYIRSIQPNPASSWSSRLGFWTLNGNGGTPIERMSIDNLGNVGIGTTSITNGTTYGGGGQINLLKLSSGGYPALEINSTSSGGGSIQFTYGTNLPNQVSAFIGYNYVVGTVNDFNIYNVANGLISFGTNNSERMRITSGGLVLIGTTSSSGVDKVRINNDGASSYSTVNITNANSTANFYVGVGGGSVANSNLQNNAYVWNAAASSLVFGTSDSARLTISSTGTATFTGGINAGTLYLGSLGTGTVYSSSGTLTNTNPSDKRLKENITPITYGLNEILKLNPVSFDWKNDNNKNKQFGFIAQEVQQIMPEAVIEGEYLGLEKDAIYTALINAIKELEARLKTLENK